MVGFDFQTIFFVVGILFFAMLALLAFPALIRLNRILGRLDEVSHEMAVPAKHIAQALSALQESAIAAGVAYFMKKAQEFMASRNEEHHNQPPRRVV